MLTTPTTPVERSSWLYIHSSTKHSLQHMHHMDTKEAAVTELHQSLIWSGGKERVQFCCAQREGPGSQMQHVQIVERQCFSRCSEQFSQLLLQRDTGKGITIMFKEISAFNSVYCLSVRIFVCSFWVTQEYCLSLFTLCLNHLCDADKRNCFANHFASVKYFEIMRWKTQGAPSCQGEIHWDLPEWCPLNIQAIKIIYKILLLIISGDPVLLTFTACNDQDHFLRFAPRVGLGI